MLKSRNFMFVKIYLLCYCFENLPVTKSKCHILPTCWIKRLWNVAFSRTFCLFQPPFGAHYGSFWILWRRSGKHSTNLCLGSDPHPPASFAQEIFLDRRSLMWSTTKAQLVLFNLLQNQHKRGETTENQCIISSLTCRTKGSTEARHARVPFLI